MWIVRCYDADHKPRVPDRAETCLEVVEMCSAGQRATSWWRCYLTLSVVTALAVSSGDVPVDRGSEPAARAVAYRVGENNGCTSARFAYGGKGFSQDDVPSSMITGQSVRAPNLQHFL